uniref:Periostin, osteoblast specific factor a n=1 Tax=Esox lucius TaxID=8010 RepID=A0A6Q2Y7S2_ESOLU
MERVRDYLRMKLVFVAALALFALSSVDRVDSSAYDKIVTHSRIRARLEGPNVCALQQVLGTKKKYFSTCRNWYKGSICGKKAMVLYECCPGYMKLQGMKGCPAVAPIDHVYGTLGLVKADMTQKYSDISKLREEIEGKGSFTMFAPSDEAWELLNPEVRSGLVSNVNIELYNALHYHMVKRRLLTKDLKNDMTVTSMYNNLGLYINHYSNGIVTVNCARIIYGNQVATNGVVHVIDRVITAVGNTIQDVLEVEDELTSFSAVALASGMMDKLGQPGHFTLFAPTNEAMDALGSRFLERIMGDKAIIAALVNYHLLNSVQCSEAIMAGTVYETAEGSTVEIGCDGDSLTVNGFKMVLRKDIVTTNGVIHLIDKVLIPNSAKEVMELVGDSQSTYNDLMSELGLSAAMKSTNEYTLLAPQNHAFSNEVLSMDQSQLKRILENHILLSKITLSDLYHGQRLNTISGNVVRAFIYRTAVCIENACMLRGSKEGSNGALHPMKSLIKPAKTTMYQVLKNDGRFRIFLSLMESADLLELLKQEGSYTVFAPTNDAFQGLTPKDLALLTSDVNALRTILLYHFSNGVFINQGLEGGVTNLLKTIQGHNLQLLSVNNSIHVNSLNVPDFDLMATNGVIHVVKNILYPGDLPVGREDLLALLKRLIKYLQIKYVSGYTYREIPLTFMSKLFIFTVTSIINVTRVIEGEPSITKVTRVIEGEPSITKVTRVIEGEPSITKVTRVIEGEPSITKVTRVIEGEPSITKVTRVIEGEPSVTKVTRVIESKCVFEMVGPDFSRITTYQGNTELIDQESEKITKLIQAGGHRGAQANRPPVGVRRRKTRLVRRHNNQRPRAALTNPNQHRPVQTNSSQ